MKILCSGYLIREPIGGFTWHHLQYLVGFRRLGHEVTYFEDHGWPDSCYDAARDVMTADPAYGIEYMRPMFDRHGLGQSWCFLAEDGTAYGLPRERLAELCAQCDLYVNISNINWIPELEECRRRVLVDTDPVFTQIGGHGLGGPFEAYDARFTFGENVHRPGCEMPTAGTRWRPTRQPVVPELWDAGAGDASDPFTTVMNWTAYGDREHEGRLYGQKDREFQPFFSLPSAAGAPMEIAVNGPPEVRERLAASGWRVADPLEVTRTPRSFQEFLRRSSAEFCVAKHGYVSTRSGWFSERSASYLATGRPVVVQDTGFSANLPVGEGLLAFTSPDEALAAIDEVTSSYARHGRAARELARAHFDSDAVLTRLIEEAFSSNGGGSP